MLRLTTASELIQLRQIIVRNLALLDIFLHDNLSQTTVVGYDTRYDSQLSRQSIVLKTGLLLIVVDSKIHNYKRIQKAV